MYGKITMQNVYVSKDKNSEARLDNHKNAIFAYGSPIGFRNIMDDKSNYRQFRNKSFICAKLAWSRVKESSVDIESSSQSEHSLLTEFIFPKTDFGTFSVNLLTRKCIKPKRFSSLVTNFNEKMNSNLTNKEGEMVFKDVFSYLKEAGLLFLKGKSIEDFPKTCCFNQFMIYGSKVHVKPRSI